MTDEHRPHPAPVPDDADAFEEALAARWRALGDENDGPSELANARILRAAREAAAAGDGSGVTAAGTAERPQAGGPNWPRWSAAAGLLLAVTASLLLWRAEPDAPAAPTAAEFASAPAPVADAAAPRKSERPQVEEIARNARRMARPVAAQPAPARAMAQTPEVSMDVMDAPVRFAAEAERAEQAGVADLALEAFVLEGRLLRSDDAWRLATEGQILQLDLTGLADDVRATLQSGSTVRIRFLPTEAALRVLTIEALPEASELADEADP